MARGPTEIAPGVFVAQSRPYATNTTVLVSDGAAVVVDPAWFADDLEELAQWLQLRGLTVAAGVATHEHFDHVLWHPALGDAPRWSSAATARRLGGEDRAKLLEPAAAFLSTDLLELAGRLEPLVAEDVPWPGSDLVAIEHDAHARGHLALLHEESGTLVAGDMLSDIELPMPDDDDATLDTYMRGLDILEDAVRRCAVLIPGHGSPTTDPLSRLNADRRYVESLLDGRHADDPRIQGPDMMKLHRANLRRAAAGH